MLLVLLLLAVVTVMEVFSSSAVCVADALPSFVYLEVQHEFNDSLWVRLIYVISSIGYASPSEKDNRMSYVIRRLAHEAFRELKASALGIRLSDLPCALQFLFFGDSASLLTPKGGGGGGGGGSDGGRGANRSAKDVHLVM